MQGKLQNSTRVAYESGRSRQIKGARDCAIKALHNLDGDWPVEAEADEAEAEADEAEVEAEAGEAGVVVEEILYF